MNPMGIKSLLGLIVFTFFISSVLAYYPIEVVPAQMGQNFSYQGENGLLNENPPVGYPQIFSPQNIQFNVASGSQYNSNYPVGYLYNYVDTCTSSGSLDEILWWDAYGLDTPFTGSWTIARMSISPGDLGSQQGWTCQGYRTTGMGTVSPSAGFFVKLYGIQPTDMAHPGPIFGFPSYVNFLPGSVDVSIPVQAQPGTLINTVWVIGPQMGAAPGPVIFLSTPSNTTFVTPPIVLNRNPSLIGFPFFDVTVYHACAEILDSQGNNVAECMPIVI